jgi:hypothetical protein
LQYALRLLEAAEESYFTALSLDPANESVANMVCSFFCLTAISLHLAGVGRVRVRFRINIRVRVRVMGRVRGWDWDWG